MADRGALPAVDVLFDGAACGLVLTDPDGTIRHANAAFCAWVGVDLAALAGQRRFQDFLTVGGRIFHQTHWGPLLQMQGSLAEVKVELMASNGRPFPVVMNAVRREHKGTLFHELALFVALDRHRYEQELMAARVRAEELLATQEEVRRDLALANARIRVAMDAARLHVWNVDPETGRRRYNDSVAILLGFPTPGPVSDEEFMAHIEPIDRDTEAAAFANARMGDHPTYDSIFRINGTDGVQRTVRATGETSFTDGLLVPFVGVLQDITELAAQWVTAEDRARFSEQMIGIVSHDLRNPLTAIRMGTRMLANPTAEASKRDRIAQHMDASVERALRLVQDLLDFTQAKLGSGMTVSPRDIDIHLVVAEAVDELRMSFPGRPIAHVQEGHGPCLTDADRLTQLLGNLVGNAMTYGDAQQPVTITSRVNAETFVVEVHNFGAPIPTALLPVLFEPMTRGTAGATDQRSLGLGLFIVRDIVRAHHGAVEVSSTSEAGTVFKVILPRN